MPINLIGKVFIPLWGAIIMIVLKIGGSAITDKTKYARVSRKGIRAVSSAISRAWKRGRRDIIVVHGAGSFGHPQVERYKIGKGIKGKGGMLGFARTHSSVSSLSVLIVNALIQKGVPAISVPPVALIIQKNKRIASFYTKAVNELLRNGYLPVLYGDMVLDRDMGGSVCSGDQIAAYLGKKAEKIIFASNVDGILAKGRLVRRITKKNRRKVLGEIGGAKGIDVTGGMRGKIKELMRIKKPSYIVNALRPERVSALLLGKKAVCTKIVP